METRLNLKWETLTFKPDPRTVHRDPERVVHQLGPHSETDLGVGLR
jgi:hypothetical protein